MPSDFPFPFLPCVSATYCDVLESSQDCISLPFFLRAFLPFSSLMSSFEISTSWEPGPWDDWFLLSDLFLLCLASQAPSGQYQTSFSGSFSLRFPTLRAEKNEHPLPTSSIFVGSPLPGASLCRVETLPRPDVPAAPCCCIFFQRHISFYRLHPRSSPHPSFEAEKSSFPSPVPSPLHFPVFLRKVTWRFRLNLLSRFFFHQKHT